MSSTVGNQNSGDTGRESKRILSLYEVTTPFHIGMALCGDRPDLDAAWTEGMIHRLRGDGFAIALTRWIDEREEQLTARGSLSLRNFYCALEAVLQCTTREAEFKGLQHRLKVAGGQLSDVIAAGDVVADGEGRNRCIVNCPEDTP